MPTTQSAIAAVAMVAVLVLAGCAGPISNGTATGTPDGETPAGDVAVADGGTVEFYVSDEENAIDDFAHLNVTITMIGLHRTGDAGREDAASPTGTATEAPGTATATVTETTSNATSTPTGTATASPVATATPTADGDEESADADGADEADGEEETEGEDGDADEDEKEGEGNAKWIEYEVNRTVDLTELKGPNATKLDALAAPNGSYDKVFVYVDGIEATLTNGDEVNVKLPSSKLQIKKGFVVGDGEDVSFVFDLAIHEAGNSGKYILRPVISQSGTSDEVDIEDVDEREAGDAADEEDDDREEGDADDGEDDDREEDEADDEDDDENETDAAALTAEFQGPVEPGADATVKVTGAEGPVEGATVAVNGEQVGTTDTSGTLTFAVPENATAVEVTVEKGDAEAELAREFVDGTESAALARY